MSARSSFNSHGFSLVEVVVAMGLLTAVSLGVAQLFAVSTRANVVARGQTSTTVLAEQKMEQIRSLTWGFDLDGMGLPVSDTSSNLAVYPPGKNGSGLNPSPTDSLERNVAGFVDFLDANGAWVGTGAVPPPAAVFIRRWSILPLPTNPNNTLVIQVLVTSIANEHRRSQTSEGRFRMPGDALLISVKTRKAS
ncbi:MAG TPA: prepilin-type N-terminal cleavage/methylation domain-containing protein [Vicinamibacterales bacterium]|nr:prepilin-type N-terminal cleavage/methylation domain-containing protein [Vicinamibacterales bacterium]